MATVKVSREIAAPVDTVFKMFTDIDHGPEHVSAIKSIEMLTTGGFELGARWREKREIMGRLDDAEMEVTAYERNHSYTITHHKGGVRIDTTFSFDPSPAGTTVGVEFALSHQGMPPGLLAPLEWAIAGKVREVLTHDLTDLKQSVEHVATRKG